MKDLIMAQRANGSWNLRQIDSLSVDSIRKSFPQSISMKVDEESLVLWMTAIVVTYLTTQFPSQNVNWDLVVEKARKWMKKEEKRLGASSPVDWESEATNFLSQNGLTV